MDNESVPPDHELGARNDSDGSLPVRLELDTLVIPPPLYSGEGAMPSPGPSTRRVRSMRVVTQSSGSPLERQGSVARILDTTRRRGGLLHRTTELVLGKAEPVEMSSPQPQRRQSDEFVSVKAFSKEDWPWHVRICYSIGRFFKKHLANIIAIALFYGIGVAVFCNIEYRDCDDQPAPEIYVGTLGGCENCTFVQYNPETDTVVRETCRKRWTVVDAIYFSTVTVTTVGYGDITPETDLGRIFAFFWVLFGLCVVFSIVSKVAEFAVKKAQEKISKRKAAEAKARRRRRKRRKHMRRFSGSREQDIRSLVEWQSQHDAGLILRKSPASGLAQSARGRRSVESLASDPGLQWLTASTPGRILENSGAYGSTATHFGSSSTAMGSPRRFSPNAGLEHRTQSAVNLHASSSDGALVLQLHTHRRSLSATSVPMAMSPCGSNSDSIPYSRAESAGVHSVGALSTGVENTVSGELPPEESYILRMLFAFGLYLLSVICGAAFVKFHEDFSLLDSLWWAFVTTNTIGYGDLPLSKESSRVFCVFYLLGAVALAAVGLGQVNATHVEMLHDDKQRRLLNRNLDLPQLLALGDGEGVDKFAFVTGMLVVMEKITEDDVAVWSDKFDELDVVKDGLLDLKDLQAFAEDEERMQQDEIVARKSRGKLGPLLGGAAHNFWSQIRRSWSHDTHAENVDDDEFSMFSPGPRSPRSPRAKSPLRIVPTLEELREEGTTSTEAGLVRTSKHSKVNPKLRQRESGGTPHEAGESETSSGSFSEDPDEEKESPV